MPDARKAWIGCDLDGTLAEYGKWQGPDHIGAPIPVMVERVKRWLSEGRIVKIFTARVSCEDRGERDIVETAIKAWCLEHIGQELEITCVKDYDLLELWDDRAVQVIPNTGIPVGQSTRGLD